MHNQIIHPPLKERQKILDKYNESLSSMDHLDAFIQYRNLMGLLYYRYNSWLRPVMHTREYYENLH